MLKIKKTKLSNGTRLVVMPMQSTEAVTVMILFRAGSRYETKDINGIAHFLEHMFFKGGERYPDPQSVASAIDGVGGMFNAFTTNEFVGYWIKVAKEHTEKAFDVLSDMLVNAKFEEDGLKRERGVILEEYKMIHDDPKILVDYEFGHLMFGDHPLGRPVIGSPRVITTMTRQKIFDYKKKLYTASNMVVAVGGNTSLADIKKFTNRYLAYPNSSKKNQPVPFSKPKPDVPVKLIKRTTEQAHLVVGVPTFGALHRDRHTAQVLSAVLGGGMSSRLFMSVRERLGLAYYVYAFADFYADTGYLAAKAGVDKNRIDLAIQTILKEFKRIAEEPVSAKELKKAKELIVGRTVLSTEDSDDVALRFGSQEVLYDQIETIAEKKKKIRAVTAEEIQSLAQRIFKQDKLKLAVIGPYSGQQKFKSLLKL